MPDALLMRPVETTQLAPLEALAERVMALTDLPTYSEQNAEGASVVAALRQSQKLAAIGQLTGGIAHDFNNLLTGIIGSIDIARRRMAADRPAEVLRFLDAASSAAHRAAALTNRLLAFARQQSFDATRTDVNMLVADMEDMLGRTLGKEVSLDVALANGLWAAMTDANQLENAVLNLAINARDAMPGGGQLTIETSNIHLDENYARQRDEVFAGDYVAVSVSDTGTGMSSEVIAHAFEPFFTTKAAGAGTGLGLSMIHGFVKQSRGHVSIYSEVGRGTTIRLYLPRALNEPAAPPPVAMIVTPRGEGETVLVVEDDALVRLLITSMLGELGYRCMEAPDAATALAILQTKLTVDLLITDVGLPVTTGSRLAEIAQRLRPDLRVLFITGYAEVATVRGGFLAAGMNMLSKPFALHTFGSKVREMIKQS
jgi:signal transduction histidine kinase/CheY-like chemotaxis protein